jgi:glutamate-ammonia-ligase adenylyltransferase
MAFFAGDTVTPQIDECIRGWFHGDIEAPARLRDFVTGDWAPVLTREQVELFVVLARHFDRVFGDLAAPVEVLKRVSAFSRRYGLPKQFLKTCETHPRFFEALCRLFDRSQFIYEFLTEHPEIIDEVLGPGYHRDKSVNQHRAELRRGPPDERFGDWLRLYVKAEEVRFMVRELLAPDPGGTPPVPRQLEGLADSVIQKALVRTHAEARLAVVALGKYGGGELTFGSDLDLVLVGTAQEAEVVPQFLKLLRCAYKIDFRLRPWGDAGALVTTPKTFRDYHFAVWERLAWTRARLVAGPPALAHAFMELVDEKVFGPSLTGDDLARIGAIRALMEREKGQPSVEGEIPFKAGRGGLVDIEFLVQRHQLSQRLRGRELRAALAQLAAFDVIAIEAATRLREHYDFFRRVEHAVRRDKHSDVSALRLEKIPALARWLGFSGDLRAELQHRMNETRSLVRKWIGIETFPR